MRIRALFCSAFLICLIWSQQALARNVEGDPPECTAANSAVVTLAQLWSEGRRLKGDCVALQGYRIDDVIFTEQRAFYAYAATRSSAPKGVVGIPYPGMNDGGEGGLQRGTYFGRVSLCSDDRRSFRRSLAALRRAPSNGEIVLVHLYGFCAGSSGPALRVDNAVESPADDLVRLADDGLRRSLGELLDPTADYPYRPILVWLAEIATDGGCTPDYRPRAAPTGPSQGAGVPVWQPKPDARRIRALSRWCGTKARQVTTYLVNRSSPSAFEQGVALDAVICLCTTESCADKWPVALIDTGWERERPYFCQRVKLRPRLSSIAEGEEPNYAEYSWEFQDDYIADQARGFREAADPTDP